MKSAKATFEDELLYKATDPQMLYSTDAELFLFVSTILKLHSFGIDIKQTKARRPQLLK